MFPILEPLQTTALPALLFLVWLPLFVLLRERPTRLFFCLTSLVTLVIVAGPPLAGALLLASALGYVLIEGAATLRNGRRAATVVLALLFHATYWASFHLPLPAGYAQAELRAADRPGIFLFFSGIALTFFRLLSYMHERLRLGAARLAPADYLTYMLFFPQFRHGPIERPHSFALRLRQARARWTVAEMRRGLARVGFGLLSLAAGGGLVVLTGRCLAGSTAHNLARAWEQPQDLTLPQLLLVLHVPGLFLYAVESGFASVQLGVARVFGVVGTENFRFPFMATDPGKFWRRWNISLSSWLRDYAYIPLGGRHRHKYLNVLLVFIYCGVLHGWQMRFLVWGISVGGTTAGYAWLADRLRPRARSWVVRHRWLAASARLGARLLTLHWFCLGATIVFDPESCGYRVLRQYVVTLWALVSP